jgi:hypothetical protein
MLHRSLFSAAAEEVRLANYASSISFSLRPSAYLCVLCVNDNFNAEDAEIRRGPHREDRLANDASS